MVLFVLSLLSSCQQVLRRSQHDMAQHMQQWNPSCSSMLACRSAHGPPACLSCLQESPVANRIKEAFFSEKGLAGNVHRLPFDKLFAIDSVKKVGW